MLTHGNLSASAQEIAAWLSSETRMRKSPWALSASFAHIGMTVLINFRVLLGGT